MGLIALPASHPQTVCLWFYGAPPPIALPVALWKGSCLGQARHGNESTRRLCGSHEP